MRFVFNLLIKILQLLIFNQLRHIQLISYTLYLISQLHFELPSCFILLPRLIKYFIKIKHRFLIILHHLVLYLRLFLSLHLFIIPYLRIIITINILLFIIIYQSFIQIAALFLFSNALYITLQILIQFLQLFTLVANFLPFTIIILLLLLLWHNYI